jgi:hypothetical protein
MSVMSQSDFARHIGKTPGYITQQKDAGRIVMQGRMVNVEETIKLMGETSDPSKAGVVERHEREREQKASSTDASAPLSTSQDKQQAMDELTGKAGSAYQRARASREESNAKLAQIACDKEIGLLRVASEIELLAADAGVICCERIESMIYALSPLLASEGDETKILSMMLDHWEIIRGDLSRKLKDVSR